MKKIMALLMAMVMVLCMFAGCDTQKEDPGATSPLNTIDAPTEPPKTEMELALEEAIAAIEVAKKKFEELNIANGDNSVSINPKSALEELKSLIVESAEDASVYEYGDPDIAGVKERLSYKKIIDQEAYKGYYWHFFADSAESDGLIKWVELDPLTNYDGSKTISINGIDLTNSFTEITQAWGAPDYAGIDLREGQEIIVLRWDYDMGVEDGCVVSVYACFNSTESANIANAIVHDLYVNLDSSITAEPEAEDTADEG